MPATAIFFIGLFVSVVCATGLFFTVLQMKALGHDLDKK